MRGEAGEAGARMMLWSLVATSGTSVFAGGSPSASEAGSRLCAPRSPGQERDADLRVPGGRGSGEEGVISTWSRSAGLTPGSTVPLRPVSAPPANHCSSEGFQRRRVGRFLSQQENYILCRENSEQSQQASRRTSPVTHVLRDGLLRG